MSRRSPAPASAPGPLPEHEPGLIGHVDWQLRPPAWFYGQLEHAIELAAKGQRDAMVEVDRRRYTVADVIEDWDLQEFVERFGEEPEPSEHELWPGDRPF